MELLYLLKAAFLGLVQGVTEFIPISSTAHLLILGDWIGFNSGNTKVFEIVIQLGSILAVIWIYRARIWQIIRGIFTGDKKELLITRNLFLAFMPAVVIGLLLINVVNELLDKKFYIYTITLILGGLIMLWVESRPSMSKHSATNQPDVARKQGQGLDEITWVQALIVGFAQCLALIPGTSRSGATIIAGMAAGVPRIVATEFSFFLAMPTMIAASALSLYKYGHELNQSNVVAIVVGFVIAFLSALFLVKALLRFISKHSYRAFAWYRIVFGLVVALWIVAR